MLGPLQSVVPLTIEYHSIMVAECDGSFGNKLTLKLLREVPLALCILGWDEVLPASPVSGYLS